MFGLRIFSPRQLSQILAPLGDFYDSCWWYLNGYGMSLPDPLDITLFPLPQEYTIASIREFNRVYDNQRFLARQKQIEEYSRWMDDSAGYRVGIPGWYSRYIDYVDSHWTIYFAVSGGSRNILPRTTLDWLEAFREADCFDDPAEWPLPDDVVTICRNPDSAYWEVFFKELNWRTSIENHLRRFDAEFSEFQPQE